MKCFRLMTSSDPGVPAERRSSLEGRPKPHSWAEVGPGQAGLPPQSAPVQPYKASAHTATEPGVRAIHGTVHRPKRKE